MGVVVLGDIQAVTVAGYVAAISGRTVYLVRPDAPAVSEVKVGGRVRKVDVVPCAEIPAEPIDAVVVVTESGRLCEVLRPLAPRLAGAPLLLAPGGFAGALRVRSWFGKWGLQLPEVAEATGFPVGGELEGDRLWVRSIKHNLPIASVDESSTHRLHSVFAELLPELVTSELTTTSMSNTNHMIHPGIVLMNASRVENGEPFSLYRSGISPAVGSLLEAVDRERMALMERLGSPSRSLSEWMVGFYGTEGMAGSDIVECLHSFTPFADVPGPGTLDHRYLVDDVPFGLAQWSALAHHLDVEVPHVDALLTLLRSLDPALDLGPDLPAFLLFRQFLASTQGVTA